MNPVYEKEFEVEEVLQKLVNIATDKSYFLIKWEGY